MVYAIVKHKVEDYHQWLPFFQGHKGAREAAGLKEERVHRGVTDPNEVVIVMRYGDAEKAKAFFQSPDLQATMQRAGVLEAPTVYLVDDPERI